MKSFNLSLLLIALLTSSCQTKKSNVESKSEITNEAQVISYDLSEFYEETSVSLTIGQNTISYLPVYYKHRKISNGFEILDRETDLLAARFIGNNEVNIAGWIEDKKILNFKTENSGASIVVENLDLSAELIYKNMGIIQRDFLKEIVNGQLVIKNKDQRRDGVFIKKLTDAPMLYNPDTNYKLAPSRAAMYDYKISGQYYLVKRNLKNESGFETFDLLEGLNLKDTPASSFKVETKVEKLENGYSLIEFKVSNPSTTKAFLISNPFFTVDSKCREVGSPFTISSYREGDNTIVAKMVLKTSSRPLCLGIETDHLEGQLYIFDANLNSLMINY